MDIFLTILAIIVLFIGVPVVGLLLRDRIFYPTKKDTPEEIAERVRRHWERMRNPDFAALEKHFGHPFPAALVQFYGRQFSDDDGDIVVAPTTDAREEDHWHIWLYEPADLESLEHEWEECRSYFGFARDSCGNPYLVDPRLDDPPVIFFDHDGGQFSHVCDSLSAFLAWPRVPEPASWSR